MKTSLYSLHNAPQTLYKFDEINRMPGAAYILLRANPEWEKILIPQIMRDPESAYSYAAIVMQGKPWPDAEPYIAQDPEWAYYYAQDMLGGARFPQAEPEIMKDPEWAYSYARDMMNTERWPAAEPYIMQDPEHAYYYARDIINAPWPQAEPSIQQDHEWWQQYRIFARPRRNIRKIRNKG